MPRNDFIPGPDATFLEWIRQLNNAAHELDGTIHPSPSDLATLDQDIANFQARLQASVAAEAAAKAATDLKRTSRRAAEQHLRSILRRFKADPDYTEAIGAKLGIRMAQSPTVTDNFRPSLTVTAMPHGVVGVAFAKGLADGVNIYSQKDSVPAGSGTGAGADGADAKWELLGRSNYSPYRDERPLLVPNKPETRHYRAVYVISDAEVGQYSDTAIAIAHP